MATPDETRASMAELALVLETVAEQLEGLMPKLRKAREALSGSAPGSAHVTGYEGSIDALDAGIGEGFGFGRVDRARLRIIAALKEPLDDVPRP